MIGGVVVGVTRFWNPRTTRLLVRESLTRGHEVVVRLSGHPHIGLGCGAWWQSGKVFIHETLNGPPRIFEKIGNASRFVGPVGKGE